jgi:hypothetical protein
VATKPKRHAIVVHGQGWSSSTGGGRRCWCRRSNHQGTTTETGGSKANSSSTWCRRSSGPWSSCGATLNQIDGRDLVRVVALRRTTTCRRTPRATRRARTTGRGTSGRTSTGERLWGRCARGGARACGSYRCSWTSAGAPTLSVRRVGAAPLHDVSIASTATTAPTMWWPAMTPWPLLRISMLFVQLSSWRGIVCGRAPRRAEKSIARSPIQVN